MSADEPAKLTLGPVLFHWPADVWRDFYFRVADEAPVDAVYLGEVVCSKRAPFSAPHLPDVIERLAAAGKTVVLSSLALIMDERDMETARAVTADADALVEANDIAIAAELAGRPHVIGPFVNVYNEGTLDYLARNGAVRLVAPCELPAKALAAMAQGVPNVAIEAQAFGRLPLALSARCYHARAHDLHKDGCQYMCGQDPDGMALETLDGDSFLAVNGTQVMSDSVCSLIRELAALRGMGIDWFRLWPHSVDMVAVARVFRDVLDGRMDADDGAARLTDLAGFAAFSNGFYYGREGAAQIAGPAAP
jgi:collagenase-like PrtC family protease